MEFIHIPNALKNNEINVSSIYLIICCSKEKFIGEIVIHGTRPITIMILQSKTFKKPYYFTKNVLKNINTIFKTHFKFVWASSENHSG